MSATLSDVEVGQFAAGLLEATDQMMEAMDAEDPGERMHALRNAMSELGAALDSVGLALDRLVEDDDA